MWLFKQVTARFTGCCAMASSVQFDLFSILFVFSQDHINSTFDQSHLIVIICLEKGSKENLKSFLCNGTKKKADRWDEEEGGGMLFFSNGLGFRSIYVIQSTRNYCKKNVEVIM